MFYVAYLERVGVTREGEKAHMFGAKMTDAIKALARVTEGISASVRGRAVRQL